MTKTAYKKSTKRRSKYNKKRNQKHKLFLHLKHESFILIPILIITIVSTAFIFIYHTQASYHEIKSISENPKDEMKKIPPSIKKKLQTASPSATFRVPILMYHYVEYVQDRRDITRQKLNINPYVFENQIITLEEAGYTFMTAKELSDVLDGKSTMPKKPILLTFDDGHWDIYTDVLPILKKYTVKATAYIIPGFIGGSDFLNDKQIKVLISSGLIEIGAHTIHHIALKEIQAKTVEEEVFGSKQILENTYHIKVYSFAYPYGSFDEQAIDIVKNAGFTTALSTIPGAEVNQANRFFIYRLRPGERTGQELLNYLQQSQYLPY